MRLHFAHCVLDLAQHRLSRAGAPVDVEPQVFDLIALLARNAGRLVTKDEIVDAIWQGRAISESAISARVAAARKALGDDGKSQRILRTVPRRGLQFVAPVRVEAGDAGENTGEDTGEDAVEPKATTDPAQRPTMRFARADDGALLAYATLGSGPPLILVQHFPSNTEAEFGIPLVQQALLELSQTHQLVRYDQRGSGLSTRALPQDIASTWADDLRCVADAAGLGRVAVMGRSSGAMHAIHFAATYPDRVSHLILQGGYAEGRLIRDGADSDIMLNMAEAGWQGDQRAFLHALMKVYFPEAPRPFSDLAVENWVGSATPDAAVRFRDFTNRHSVMPLLPKIQAPTLVVHSRGDAVHPLSEGQKLAAGIPGAELAVLESPNHYVLHCETAWAPFASALRGFLGRAPAAHDPSA